MKSTWGRRAIVMEKFGWTWEHTNWGVPFVVIQRLMADLPWYDYKKSSPGNKTESKNIKLTSGNTDEVIALFNSIPR